MLQDIAFDTSFWYASSSRVSFDLADPTTARSVERRTCAWRLLKLERRRVIQRGVSTHSWVNAVSHQAMTIESS